MTDDNNKDDLPPVEPRLLASPVQLLAFGFGSGLSPRAPGTLGTLAALPPYLLMAELSLPAYAAIVLVAAIAGVWICDVACKQLDVHDHPGIVWDEFVGFWITMFAVPSQWIWIVCGFLVFRLFDIIKPWPINLMDKEVQGGWGVMLDDIVAGFLACLTLHFAALILRTPIL